MANIYEQVKQAIQDVIAPDLAKIDGKIDVLGAEIKRLDEKIDSKHNEAVGFFQRLDEKIDSLHNEMNIRFNAMDEKVKINFEFRDRFANLETKVASLMNSR